MLPRVAETVVNAPGTRVRDARGFAELRYEHDFKTSALSARAYYDATRYKGFWVYPSEIEEGVEALVVGFDRR